MIQFKVKLNQKHRGVARFSGQNAANTSTSMVDVEVEEADEFDALEEGKSYTVTIEEDDEEEVSAKSSKAKAKPVQTKAGLAANPAEKAVETKDPVVIGTNVPNK